MRERPRLFPASMSVYECHGAMFIPNITVFENTTLFEKLITTRCAPVVRLTSPLQLALLTISHKTAKEYATFAGNDHMIPMLVASTGYWSSSSSRARSAHGFVMHQWVTCTMQSRTGMGVSLKKARGGFYSGAVELRQLRIGLFVIHYEQGVVESPSLLGHAQLRSQGGGQ